MARFNVIKPSLGKRQTHGFIPDVFHAWTEKSRKVPFKSSKRGVGHGEEKLVYELENCIGTTQGQNSRADLEHPILGKISVKNMTNDDARLGVDSLESLNRMFNRICSPLILWVDKYKDTSMIARATCSALDSTTGKSFSLRRGIERREISAKNLYKLSCVLNILRSYNGFDNATRSEYFIDMKSYLQDRDFTELCNECVRREAIDYSLIIVHEHYGWMLVRNLSNIYCPRITSGSCRIRHVFRDEKNDSEIK